MIQKQRSPSQYPVPYSIFPLSRETFMFYANTEKRRLTLVCNYVRRAVLSHRFLLFLYVNAKVIKNTISIASCTYTRVQTFEKPWERIRLRCRTRHSLAFRSYTTMLKLTIVDLAPRRLEKFRRTVPLNRTEPRLKIASGSLEPW